jgi:adenylylsulfate kinase-like enzyme
MPKNSAASKETPAGLALLIAGFPAAGKTSLGRELTARIEKHFGRQVSLLDGDEVRKLLSSELGFSRASTAVSTCCAMATLRPRSAGTAGSRCAP